MISIFSLFLVFSENNFWAQELKKLFFRCPMKISYFNQ